MNIKDKLKQRLANTEEANTGVTNLEELKEAHLEEISGAHTDNHYSQHDDLPSLAKF